MILFHIRYGMAGVGLDFVEGNQTAKLITENVCPTDKTLFAGLVKGNKSRRITISEQPSKILLYYLKAIKKYKVCPTNMFSRRRRIVT